MNINTNIVTEANIMNDIISEGIEFDRSADPTVLSKKTLAS
jgi:hypothetical protein